MKEFLEEIKKFKQKKESINPEQKIEEKKEKVNNSPRILDIDDDSNVERIDKFTVFLGDTITPKTIEETLEKLREVIKESLYYRNITGQDIKIRLILNTPGGSVISGFRLVDFIQNSPVPIITIADGLVASMGIPILLAGKEKYATKNSTLMIHQISSGAFGKLSELEDYMKLQKDLQEKLKKFILENSKLDENSLNMLMVRESFLTIEEALEYGLIDGIYDKLV